MATKRPIDSDHIKSYVIKWKGNKPVVEPTVWQPGYTPGHMETVPEAIAMEVSHLLKNIADFREKWLNLNLLAEQEKHLIAADAFGQLIGVEETDDPHETMTMPADAVSLDDTFINARALFDEDAPKVIHVEPEIEEDMPTLIVEKTASGVKIQEHWNHDGQYDGMGAYDDHQDH